MTIKNFSVGLTPDFYVEAEGRFEAALEAKFAGVDGLDARPMPERDGITPAGADIDQFDAIFALKIGLNGENLQGVERTAVIARWGVGYDTIDTAALTEHDIALAITPGAVRRPVAEAALTFIFALAKDLKAQDRITREGKWRGGLERMGTCLGGRTLGSVGCGNIGRQLFELSQSLGFGRLIAHDPFVKPEDVAGLGVELVSLEELFRASDFLTVNTLLNPRTHHLVSAELLALMKPTAYLINTARGPIVDEAALIAALREGRIAGAGLDVFEQEPLAADNPLLGMDNVLVTPHGLAWTEEIARDNSLEACENILSVFRGEAPAGIVNRDVLDRPGFQAKLARYRERHS